MSLRSIDELIAAAGPVSRETFEILGQFENAFVKWNKVTNLIAESTIADLWSRHILDSAQLLKIRPGANRWLDLGSGGGFPGIICAILLKESPGAIVELIESNRKKASFLHSVIGQFQLPATVHSCRIEQAQDRVSMPEVVSARALSGLNTLLQLSHHWISPGAVGLFHKGRDYQREIEESSHFWIFDLIEHPSIIESQSVILEIANLRRR